METREQPYAQAFDSIAAIRTTFGKKKTYFESGKKKQFNNVLSKRKRLRSNGNWKFFFEEIPDKPFNKNSLLE